MRDLSATEVDLVRKVSLFQGLDAEARSSILEDALQRSVSCDAFYFHEGDAATSLYVLIQGRVRIIQTTPEGHQVVLRIIVPGGMFGGIAAFEDTVYPVSAEAITDSKSLRWDGRTMVRMMERYPSVALRALKYLTTRLHEAQDRYRELATERVERRVARALVRLVRQSGRKTKEGVLIDIPLSRQDLAEMTGTTLYTVSRILSGWEQKDLVKTGREWVIITSPHAMVSLAEDLPEISGGDAPSKPSSERP